MPPAKAPSILKQTLCVLYAPACVEAGLFVRRSLSVDEVTSIGDEPRWWGRGCVAGARRDPEPAWNGR